MHRWFLDGIPEEIPAEIQETLLDEPKKDSLEEYQKIPEDPHTELNKGLLGESQNELWKSSLKYILEDLQKNLLSDSHKKLMDDFQKEFQKGSQ